MLRAEVNGVTLSCEEAGTGPPLFLIHALPAPFNETRPAFLREVEARGGGGLGEARA